MPYADENKNSNSPSRLNREVDLYKIIRIKNQGKQKYSKDEIIEAAKHWIISGNTNGTAKELKIPVATLRRWIYQDWWPILVEEIKFMKNTALDGQYTNLVEKSLRAVFDRLENGDEVVVGKEIKRKKVSARDAALIAAVAFDKRQLLRGDPTQIRQNNFNVDERLVDLQQTFDKIAKKADEKVIEGTVIRDVEEIKEKTAFPGTLIEVDEV